jgi:hypothetical protein
MVFAPFFFINLLICLGFAMRTRLPAPQSISLSSFQRPGLRDHHLIKGLALSDRIKVLAKKQAGHELQQELSR